MAGIDYVIFYQYDSSCVYIFREMRETGELCDVVVKVGDKSLSAHRIVLAAGIPYFRAMFNSEMLEGTAREVTVKEIDPEALESLINFVYSSKLRITKANVEALMVASSFLQLEKVTEACCKFITSRIDPTNVVNVRHLADSMGRKQLMEIADHYISENFDEVSKSEDFLRLPYKFLKELIERDNLAVTQEEVFEAVMRWVKSSEVERLEFLPELLRGVRLLFLTFDFLVNRVNSYELIRASSPCRDLMDEVKNYHLLPADKSTLVMRPRTRTMIMRHVAALNSGSQGLYAVCYPKYFYSSIKYFDLRCKKWHTIVYFQKANSILAEGNQIYAISEKEIENFKLSTQEWAVVGHISSSLSRSAVVLHNKKIYFFGGGFLSSDKVRCFNPQTKSWLNEGHTTIRRSSPGVVSLGDSIYILGGYSTSRDRLSVEKYSPRTGQCEKLSPMLYYHHDHGAAALKGNIYVCGGYNNGAVRIAEVYNPESDEWSIIPPMAVPRYHFSLVPCNGKLYAIGGHTLKGDTPSVEIYDPETELWSIGVPVNDFCLARECSHSLRHVAKKG